MTEFNKQSPQPLQPSPGWPTIPSPYVRYYGHIAVSSTPDGAEIYIDGKPVMDTTGRIATTPVTLIDVSVGTHTITFKKSGYQDTSVRTFVENGMVSDAFAILKPIQSQYQHLQYGLGDIFIDSDPKGAYIYIDSIPQIDMQGRPVLTPAKITGIFQGMHEVQISLDGYYSKRIIINIIPDQLNNVYIKLQRLE